MNDINITTITPDVIELPKITAKTTTDLHDAVINIGDIEFQESFVYNPFNDLIHLVVPAIYLIGFCILFYIVLKIVETLLEKLLYATKCSEKARNICCIAFKVMCYIAVIYYCLHTGCATMLAMILACTVVYTIIGLVATNGKLQSITNGIIIKLFKPFKVGDHIIDSDKHDGIVQSISLIYTKILDKDGNTIVIPNKRLANRTITIVNEKDNTEEM